MGIDDVVALDCAAKHALTLDGIVEMVKARSRAEAIVAIARQQMIDFLNALGFAQSEGLDVLVDG